jgi:elongation factor 2
LINYRETVKGGCEPIMAKSPNRHNKIFMKVEPLEPEIAHMLRTGEISDLKDKKQVADLLKGAGWDTDTIKLMEQKVFSLFKNPLILLILDLKKL